MGIAVRNAAYSPNIKERLDHSCALFDRRGRLIAQAEHIPVHLGSLPWGLARTLEVLAPAASYGGRRHVGRQRSLRRGHASQRHHRCPRRSSTPASWSDTREQGAPRRRGRSGAGLDVVRRARTVRRRADLAADADHGRRRGRRSDDRTRARELAFARGAHRRSARAGRRQRDRRAAHARTRRTIRCRDLRRRDRTLLDEERTAHPRGAARLPDGTYVAEDCSKRPTARRRSASAPR